ncbi:MAG: methylated-DNA--[protein]-cysteine S-methyltransferase [Clostridiales bacterium]|nr:methylated-DNA--[protein]-cysteine S-methyltransferase [Clostridiales bacterium]
MIHSTFLDTEIGKIVIEADEKAVIRLGFSGEKERKAGFGSDLSAAGLEKQADEVPGVWTKSVLLEQAVRELLEYLNGQRKRFEVPLSPKGTPFQEKVWEELCQIPYGEVSTYGELAVRIGNPKGARAVGMALNRNPIMIMVPCHRIIGKDGSLTGFGGGLFAKKYLLSLEKSDKFLKKQ